MGIPRIAICHPIDPAGHVPSGIDTFVRGILKWAPDDLHYTLFGATSDRLERPVGAMSEIELGHRAVRYQPVVWMNPTAVRGRIPLIVRYTWSLAGLIRSGQLRAFEILDFHRVEPVVLFGGDSRPANVLLHQDMSVLRDGQSDIMWRHAPWLYEAIERRLFSRLTRIYSVRQSAVERYARLYPQYQEKFSFLPTWVDDTVFHPGDPAAAGDCKTSILAELGLKGTRTLLTFVGRLDHQKDPLLLLQALRESLAQRPDLHLLMVGDGDLRSRVTAAIADAGLQAHVSLVGVKGPAEIARLLRGSDLFVLSSAYEGMPIAVLEALATGLPVVSTDVGEIRLVVRDGHNGMISPGRTTGELAATICAAAGVVARLRGEPCVRSVQPYLPAKVLGIIYENHRQQALQKLRGAR